MKAVASLLRRRNVRVVTMKVSLRSLYDSNKRLTDGDEKMELQQRRQSR